MSSTEIQNQILAQLVKLTDGFERREEAVELRSQQVHEPVRVDNVKETTSTVNSADSNSTKPKKVKKVKKVRADDHIKRPPNMFILWRNQCFSPKHKEEHPGPSAAATSKAASEKWKSMSDEDKRPWQEKYNIAQAEYQLAVGKRESPKKVVIVSDELCRSDLDELRAMECREREEAGINLKEIMHQHEKSVDEAAALLKRHEELMTELADDAKKAKKEAKKAEKVAKKAEKVAKKAAKKARKEAEAEAEAAEAHKNHPLSGLIELQPDDIVGSDSDSDSDTWCSV